MKFVLRVLFVAIVAVALFLVFKYLIGFGTRGPRGVYVEHTVRRGTIEQTVEGTGAFESATSATIASKVAGRFSAPLVKEGQHVEADQVLVHIANDEIESQVGLKQAEVTKLGDDLEELRKKPEERTDVKKAKAACDRAQNDYDKLQRQLDDEEEKVRQGTTKMSPRELDDLRRNVEFAKRDAELAKDAYDEVLDAVTEADVQQAEEKLAQAKIELKRLQDEADGREVRSPIAGTVLDVMIEPEALAVDPDKEYPKDTPLFVVSDLTSLLVRGRIYQGDEAKLDRARIDDPDLPASQRIQARVYAGQTLDGYVSYLSLKPHESASGAKQFEVKISFPTPPQGVTDGLQVSFDIITARVEGVLVVPVRCVELEGGRAYVRKLVGGKPVRTPVELGVSDNNSFEVRGGLAEGDVVVWEQSSS
jgi:multidrug efflux pump subunit AcrA (membrane-fusion protein)